MTQGTICLVHLPLLLLVILHFNIPLCLLLARLPCTCLLCLHAKPINVLPLYHPRNQNTNDTKPQPPNNNNNGPPRVPAPCVRVCVRASPRPRSQKRGLGFGPTRPANKNFLRFTKIGDKKFFVGQTIITLLKRICRLAIARLLPICLHICLHPPAAAEPSGPLKTAAEKSLPSTGALREATYIHKEIRITACHKAIFATRKI